MFNKELLTYLDFEVIRNARLNDPVRPIALVRHSDQQFAVEDYLGFSFICVCFFL